MVVIKIYFHSRNQNNTIVLLSSSIYVWWKLTRGMDSVNKIKQIGSREGIVYKWPTPSALAGMKVAWIEE